ncbi:glycosyltransferase family 2 protein [Streptomyces scabiei]|uniref:glycosyltransferase family 2 protein n=1 Tax=Streptomyces scabiei TaxID=1930 RepID=UPI0039EECB33
MSSLTVVVPSRGRPHTVAQLAEAFRVTCTERTWLLFAVDEDDPEYLAYRDAVGEASIAGLRVQLVAQPKGTMVSALNHAARHLLAAPGPVVPTAIGFMGDDHRPRTEGWDRGYLTALQAGAGIVYGNDLLQGANLPTQCAISAPIVRALGHMAPEVLTHLYVDNYWRDLGRATGCLSYLPDVVVEHLHPAAGKAPWDDGHRRVNRPSMYDRDRTAYGAYWTEHQARDVLAVRQAFTGAAR